MILRKLTGNSCVAIPLTSKIKKGSWYYEFEVNSITRCAMLHQIRILSTKRFESRMTTISEKDFIEIKNAVGKFYNIT
jgi:mRNA-degrading endonuclease toxin of MazEF toxin-antitoxin module